jgi:hypothetical protein
MAFELDHRKHLEDELTKIVRRELRDARDAVRFRHAFACRLKVVSVEIGVSFALCGAWSRVSASVRPWR